MLAYFIVSDKLGVSSKHYASQQEAITDALIWFRKDPERVGKFEIAEARELYCGGCNTVHTGFSMPCQCTCDNRACECNLPAYL
jgi:hypothetical protein